MNDYALRSFADLHEHAEGLGLKVINIDDTTSLGAVYMLAAIPMTLWALFTMRRYRLERRWNRELKERTPLTVIASGKVLWVPPR